MRPLIIDDKAKTEANRVIAYAMDHPYHPGQPVPGDNPNFVAQLGTYRCVFTFTHISGKVFRHLSISVPSEKYSNPIAAFMIADLFGFTGWNEQMGGQIPKSWFGQVNEEEHAVVLAQEVTR